MVTNYIAYGVAWLSRLDNLALALAVMAALRVAYWVLVEGLGYNGA